MKDGVYESMSHPDYLALPRLSSSVIRRMTVSPQKARYDMDNPRDATPAMMLGTATHTAILEPDAFAQRHPVSPKFDRRKKDDKIAAEVFESAHPQAISQDAHDAVIGMRSALEKHSIASTLLSNRLCTERSVLWTDADAGVECKARFDLVTQGGCIADIKTTSDASHEAFSKTIKNMKYALQAQYYLMAAEAVGMSVEYFAWIVVESSAPHGVTVHRFFDCRKTRERVITIMRKYKECCESGVWPGYSEVFNTYEEEE
jgi:exodeoxyribonuclease VIII